MLRFVTRSPLWLDEALSVNIAKLPLGHIAGALRHDGHPPLYYFLLHGWMSVFGDGDSAVRALSGVFGVALLPLVWVAGRRLGGTPLGWIAVLVLSLSPFALRYGTETRMYSLVIVLVLVGYLLVDDVRPAATDASAPGRRSPLLTARCCGRHYWAMWLAAATALRPVRRWRRRRRAGHADGRRPRSWCSAHSSPARALPAVGADAALPVAHTGTPWAGAVRPPTVVRAVSVHDLGGGGSGDAESLRLAPGRSSLLGVFGAGVDAVHIDLDLRGRPEGRPIALVIATHPGHRLGDARGHERLRQSATTRCSCPLAVLLRRLGISRLWGRAVAARRDGRPGPARGAELSAT